MIQQMQAQCGGCKGTGSKIAEKDKCKSCKGEKTVKEKKTLEIHVGKGFKNGEKITFSGEADEAPDQTPGDVVVVLQQAEHPVFRREGSNLYHTHTITLLEALTGFTFSIPHLDGRTLVVKSDPSMIVKPGDVKAIKEEGFPMKNNPYVRGHLYVTFDVTFPTSAALTESTKKILKQVLPAPTASANSSDNMTDAQPEEVTLVTMDVEAEKKRFEAQEREAYEEEEENAGRGGGGRAQPQCRQQ
jgi:DnaJ family protein A protein 2